MSTIDDSRHELPTSSRQKSLGIDPMMVDYWINGSDTDIGVPVVTLGNLMDFTGNKKGSRVAGYLLGIRLLSSRHDDDNGEVPYFICVDSPGKRDHRYLRAGELNRLSSELAEQTLVLDGVGPKEIKLLGKYCSELISPSEPKTI